jgi:hypothetical protein
MCSCSCSSFLSILQRDLAQLRRALAAAFAAGPRAPAFVDALQQLAAADKSLWLDPQQLLAAAEASGGLGAAAVQAEEQMLYAGVIALPSPIRPVQGETFALFVVDYQHLQADVSAIVLQATSQLRLPCTLP